MYDNCIQSGSTLDLKNQGIEQHNSNYIMFDVKIRIRLNKYVGGKRHDKSLIFFVPKKS
jgi:hypothetical protein